MYVFRTMNSLRMSFWIVPASFSGAHALLLGGDDVEREHGQDGAVHRHRHAHLVERDAVEEEAHVEDRVDRHARPCRRRRGRAGGRCRSRGGSRGRRRSRAPSARRRGCGGRRRSSLRRSRSRRTGARSTAGARTSSGTGRARTARSPGTCRGARRRRDRPRRRARGAGWPPACPTCRRGRRGVAAALRTASKSSAEKSGKRRVMEHFQELGEEGDGIASGVEEAVDAGFPQRGFEGAGAPGERGPACIRRP